jgi:TatD DNase family protein
MLIDTHAHVNFSAFKDDGEEILRRALAEDVLVVNVGSQYSTSVRAVAYAHKFAEGVWAAVGIHPVHLNTKTIHLDPEELESAREIRGNGEDYDAQNYLELARDVKVVAIGEVGLDYHHFAEGDDIAELKAKQKKVLRAFIELANTVGKPVMLHCWDAYDDLLEILIQNPVKKKGIVHSFVGSYKTAQKFLDLGYVIGLNGIITFSESYDRLIREVPLEAIVLETDCPYLAPVPQKGERNEPSLVKLVAEKIAQVKDISVEEVAQQTTKNAKKTLFL